jgi:TRAP-type mannitol/chloroaromatic compound transport system permease small subunit
MSFVTDNIVSIWLAPLFFYILIPFIALTVYLFWRFIYFMFNPLESRGKKKATKEVAGDLDEIV